MSSITFVNGTVVPPAWLNDANTLIYTVFNAAGTAAAARTALGLGTMATQNASAVAITGGTMNGVAITSGTMSGTTVTNTTITAVDSTFSIVNSITPSKVIGFSAGAITAGQTRILTMANANLALPVVAAKGDIPSATAAGVLGVTTVGADGTILQADSSQSTGITWRSKLVGIGVVNSTSGTSIDFTGIPSWAKRITVTFVGVSTSGTNNWLLQVGAGSVTTSGYLGATTSFGLSTLATINVTNGVGLNIVSAAGVVHGSIIFSLHTGNTWIAHGTLGSSAAQNTVNTGSSIALGGTLDRVRITTNGGTDTFDAGSINVTYE